MKQFIIISLMFLTSTLSFSQKIGIEESALIGKYGNKGIIAGGLNLSLITSKGTRGEFGAFTKITHSGSYNFLDFGMTLWMNVDKKIYLGSDFGLSINFSGGNGLVVSPKIGYLDNEVFFGLKGTNVSYIGGEKLWGLELFGGFYFDL